MRTTIKAAVTAAVLVAAATMSAGSIAAEAAKKSSVDTLSTNRYTQALIDRMDPDKDGKVSKAEFMKFMEAEWNVLDKGKKGSLPTTEMVNREYFQRVDKQ